MRAKAFLRSWVEASCAVALYEYRWIEHGFRKLPEPAYPLKGVRFSAIGIIIVVGSLIATLFVLGFSASLLVAVAGLGLAKALNDADDKKGLQ